MIFGYVNGTTNYQDVTAVEAMLSMVGRAIHNEGDISGIHLLVMYGGEDISPSYYGQKPVGAHASAHPSIRDEKEAKIFRACVARKIPVLAICRGAQFACVLLGGKLWQHVDNHAGRDHWIFYGDKRYKTNSYHHQMMIPTDDMEILAYAMCLSPYKISERRELDEGDEPEIVFDPKYKVLMIQGHPEWQTHKDDLYNLTQQLVKEKLGL